jgi:hypothetical protein
VICLIVGVLIAVLWPAVQSARRAAQHAQRRNNLKQIGLCLHNFNDTYRQLPPSVRTDDVGRPICSWRFQVLPFLEAIMLGVDFGARWDDPANRFLMRHRTFCWSWKGDFPECAETNVMAIVGPGTAFDSERVTSVTDLDPDTILAMEVADSNTLWMEPGDLFLESIDDAVLGGMDGAGPMVLFADGEVWALTPEVPPSDLRSFCTVDGAKERDRNQVLGRFRRDDIE